MLQLETDFSLDLPSACASRGGLSAVIAEDGDGWGAAELCATLEFVGTPLWALDIEGRCVYINRAACQLLGYAREECVGRRLQCKFHRDCSEDWKCTKEACRFQTAVERGSAVRIDDDVIHRRDGTPVAVRYSAEPVIVGGRVKGSVISISEITEQKRAREALDEFFMASPTPLAILSLDGRIQRVNPAWESVLGFTAAELAGLPVLDLVQPEDSALAAAEFEKLLVAGERTGFECRARRKDGGYLWHLVSARVLRDLEVIYVTADDITGRKREHEALLASEERFRSAFENTLLGMAIVSPDGHFLQVNQRLCGITGFTEQELLQTNFAAITHPDDVRKSLELAGKLKEGAIPSFFLTKRYLRKEGLPVWCRVHSTVLRDAQGKPLHFVTAMEDLTDQRCAEEAARTSEEWLKFALNAAGIGLCYRGFGETTASEQQFRLYGLEPAGEWVPRERWLQAIHPDDRETVEAEQRLAGERGKPYDIEFRVMWPDRSVHWLLCRGRASHNEHGSEKVEITVDVTERKRLLETLQSDARKLAESNVELERFAYIASHDLQEPLRMVASFTQLLSQRYSGRLDERADRYINYAVDGAKRMQRLIADLLEYSRVNSKELDLRPADCEEVVQVTLQNLAAAVEESGAVVEWEALPVLVADPAQLGQLFQNLIGNAIKFRSQDAPHVYITAADAGAEWRFSVQDNGIGIDPQYADRIFQIFQRLHGRAERPGSGVGLAVCKRVVERHGGRIWVEPRTGAGSNFHFTLPKSLPKERADGSP